MRPEAQRGLGVKIFAALAAGTVVTAGVVHGLRHHHHGPEFYGERFGGEAASVFQARCRYAEGRGYTQFRGTDESRY